MKPPVRKWEQRQVPDLPRRKSRHRNWPVILRLTIISVALLLASVPAEFWLGSRALMLACYLGSGIAGTALVVYLSSKRLWVERPPSL